MRARRPNKALQPSAKNYAHLRGPARRAGAALHRAPPPRSAIGGVAAAERQGRWAGAENGDRNGAGAAATRRCLRLVGACDSSALATRRCLQLVGDCDLSVLATRRPVGTCYSSVLAT